MLHNFGGPIATTVHSHVSTEWSVWWEGCPSPLLPSEQACNIWLFSVMLVQICFSQLFLTQQIP